MAKEYLEKLSVLLEVLNIKNEIAGPIEVRHFFSGAALYVCNTICASWSPAGLAFKLEEQEASDLIKKGIAKPLKYFPEGHIKKGYVLFEELDEKTDSHLKEYFIKSAQQV
jgi:TfoX/Sxy family transcriptional regulator of competence genes